MENKMKHNFYLFLNESIRKEWLEYCKEKGLFYNAVFGVNGHPNYSMSYSSVFKPDPKEYFELLNYVQPDVPSVAEAGYTKEAFYLLFEEMLCIELYKFDAQSQEVENFIQRALKEKELLFQNPSEELQQKFCEIKAFFLILSDELGNRLLHLEKIRLRNGNTHFLWHGIFGTSFVRLTDARSRLDMVERKLALLELNPDYSEQDLEQKLAESIAENQKHLNDLKLEVAFAMRGLIFPDDSEPFSKDEMDAFRNESKKILREIFTLLHPDVLQHHPDYDCLTENQKQSLSSLWGETMTLKEEEVGYSSRCIGHSNRQLHVLKKIRDQAKNILANAGIDTDTRLIIQGDTLTDQIVWLENAIAATREHIMSVQAEQRALLNDRICRERDLMIQWPEPKQKELNEHYVKQAEKLEQKAIELESELEGHLVGRF